MIKALQVYFTNFHWQVIFSANNATKFILRFNATLGTVFIILTFSSVKFSVT